MNCKSMSLNIMGLRISDVGPRASDPEVFENAVASLVDVASILFAYQIGAYGFGLGFGMMYAGFDAFIVIWMRKPISRFARAISPFRLAKGRAEDPMTMRESDPKADTGMTLPVAVVKNPEN